MTLPSVVGVGVDLVDVDRMRTALERTPGLRQRLFSGNEQTYCDQRNDPVVRYAVRFAAKEAVMKAMGLGLWHFPLWEIEVVRADSGEPSVQLYEKALARAEKRGIDDWRLTLTHSHTSAQAIAVALGRRGTSLRLDLFAGDRDRTIHFYEDVFGFVRTSDTAGYATLVLGRVELGVSDANTLPSDHPARPRHGRHGEGVEVVIEVDDGYLAHQRASRHLADVDDPGLRPSDLADCRVVDPDALPLRVARRE